MRLRFFHPGDAYNRPSATREQSTRPERGESVTIANREYTVMTTSFTGERDTFDVSILPAESDAAAQRRGDARTAKSEAFDELHTIQRRMFEDLE